MTEKRICKEEKCRKVIHRLYRRDKVYCSNACKLKDHRKKKKEAQLAEEES